jgi:double-stranded uracil-DNA glycosylase
VVEAEAGVAGVPARRSRPTVDLDRLAAPAVPLALAELHRNLPVDSRILLRLSEGRLPAADLVSGGGFAALAIEDDGRTVDAVRLQSLPDYVGPGMRLLMVGLNPSPYAADAGVGFARPGNRFWPAMAGAGLATRDRDPVHLLRVDGIGMTDLVKRATPGVRGVDADEFTAGFDRVERLIRWLEPGTVCFLGVTGYRQAVDLRAGFGWQRRPIGGRPAYVMPNPSGANAHARPADLVEHLRTLDAGPDGGTRPPTGDQRASGTADAAPPHLDAPAGVGQALDVAAGEEDLTSVGRAMHVEHHAGPRMRGRSM